MYVYYIIYMKDGINNSKSNVRTLKLAKGATKNENVNISLHWLFRRVILTIIIRKDINVSTNIGKGSHILFSELILLDLASTI